MEGRKTELWRTPSGVIKQTSITPSWNLRQGKKKSGHQNTPMGVVSSFLEISHSRGKNTILLYNYYYNLTIQDVIAFADYWIIRKW